MQNATIVPSSFMGLDTQQVWDTELAYIHLKKLGHANSKKTTERRLVALGLFPVEIREHAIRDEFGRPPHLKILKWAVEGARKRRDYVLFAQIGMLSNGKHCLFLNDARGARFWVPLAAYHPTTIEQALRKLQIHIGKSLAVFGHGPIVETIRVLKRYSFIATYPEVYQARLDVNTLSKPASVIKSSTTSHLRFLEAESIHIIREAVAEAQNPVMLYSIGKDSGVMLHLARKSFFPAKPPFPLLHVDTRWKFQEMYLFRDWMIKECGMELIVHTNPEAIQKNINPFDHGSALHTDITKTEGLKQALDTHKFDVIFGGARRDEEKSRAKERIFSFRTATHHWDPKNQRPELWNLFNTRKNLGESIRVFPLSNWTEIDIWHYIYQENIPMVPLYLAKPRPVVVRPEMIMMVDDDRCKLLKDEEIQIRKVRFRTLGCYPLTGAVESNAETIEDILLEIINARNSERQGRKIDTDSAGSMEKKKQEGYF